MPCTQALSKYLLAAKSLLTSLRPESAPVSGLAGAESGKEAWRTTNLPHGHSHLVAKAFSNCRLPALASQRADRSSQVRGSCPSSLLEEAAEGSFLTVLLPLASWQHRCHHSHRGSLHPDNHSHHVRSIFSMSHPLQLPHLQYHIQSPDDSARWAPLSSFHRCTSVSVRVL